MFGLLIGAIFFVKPEAVLLVGIGSALPDLDREYAYFSREKFRNHQTHRALCHNYLFLALVFLVNPFLALGAFLHTALDALTTVKDRGVEWLYPFSRLVKKAAHDEHGTRLKDIAPDKVYFYQYDPIEITHKSDKDLKEEEPKPWTRTYGPALSGGLMDLGIFVGSFVLFLLWVAWTSITTGTVAGLNPHSYQFGVMLPVVIGSIGIAGNMLVGEIDRRKRDGDDSKPRPLYEAFFFVTLFLMFFAVFLGAYLNPSAVEAYEPYVVPIIIGAIATVLIAVGMPKVYKRFGRIEHHTEKGSTEKDDDIVIV